MKKESENPERRRPVVVLLEQFKVATEQENAALKTLLEIRPIRVTDIDNPFNVSFEFIDSVDKPIQSFMERLAEIRLRHPEEAFCVLVFDVSVDYTSVADAWLCKEMRLNTFELRDIRNLGALENEPLVPGCVANFSCQTVHGEFVMTFANRILSELNVMSANPYNRNITNLN